MKGPGSLISFADGEGLDSEKLFWGKTDNASRNNKYLRLTNLQRMCGTDLGYE